MAYSDDKLRHYFWRRRQAEQRMRQFQQRQRSYRRKLPESKFPFNLLEQAVRWLLLQLERVVGNLVTAALNRVRQP